MPMVPKKQYGSNNQKQRTVDHNSFDNTLPHVKMVNVLSTKKAEIITHKSIGNVYICIGEPTKDSYGLKFIIHQRMLQNRTNDEITAILTLICSAIHDGDSKADYGSSFKVTKNGITAIIDSLVSERGKICLLTGYDLNKNKEEATEAIQTVIAQYSAAPEYSLLRKQVVAVTSNI